MQTKEPWMCQAGPGFPWKQAQDVAAEASSLLPGTWIRRRHHLRPPQKTVGQWPSALAPLTPVTSQVLLRMDLPPVPCGTTSHEGVHGTFTTSPRWKQPHGASPKASSKPPDPPDGELFGASGEAGW